MPEAVTICLRAVGDDLIHKEIYEAAKQADGSYDFSSLFDHVRDMISEADISVINQETILTTDNSKIGTFPRFASPLALGDAIIDAGFSVVTHANNHALDKGYESIRETVGFWDNRSMVCCGIHTSRADSRRIRVVERKGIRVALLNYTATLNFHPRPVLHTYCVDVMKNRYRKRIRKQIEEAKKIADIVAVLPHWGVEYLFSEVPSQRSWAGFFADSGADIIIGTHPHVLQKTVTITSKDGRIVPCFYSLGNFVSCMTTPGTMLGGMADVVIEKKGNKTSIIKADIIPTVTHRDRVTGSFTVYPLAVYTDELAANNKTFDAVERCYGVCGDREYLCSLNEEICCGCAEGRSPLKNKRDVFMLNVRSLYRALTHRLPKD